MHRRSCTSVVVFRRSNERWRTVTLLGGSFPPDLTGFKVGQHENPREEWRRWKKQITAGHGIARLPAYGDYTIQHPMNQEPIEGANPSESIRYASDNYWVIM